MIILKIRLIERSDKMVNSEHNFTVDDLIVEYMVYKVNNGYEPQFSTQEFINFLYFFTSEMSVKDVLYENKKLFRRFFERKAESDCNIIPHMDMIYSEKDNDYVIKANYKLSDYDKSVINTYFMDNGMSKYDDFKGTAFQIRSIIKKYLSYQTKRKIDETIDVDDTCLMVGKCITAEIVKNIWHSHIRKQIEEHEWPEQCQDIDKYLLKMDLAKIIKLKSIKKELLDFYQVISTRIAILYQQDNNLQISNCSGSYLAIANYKLLNNGYQKTFDKTFGRYKNTLDIDLSSKTFKENQAISGIYDCDEEADVKTTISQIENDGVKKLVKALDKTIKDN